MDTYWPLCVGLGLTVADSVEPNVGELDTEGVADSVFVMLAVTVKVADGVGVGEIPVGVGVGEIPVGVTLGVIE